MALSQRESPKGKRISLFVTCIVDMIYPQTGMSVVDILQHIGVAVDFPMAQTCCGQPAFNSGYRNEARTVAKQFFKAFNDAEVIVTPSGSCAAMVRHEYPHIFTPDDSQHYDDAQRMASITWEFSEFLVDGLGITDLNLSLPAKQSFAMHDACHGLRGLGLGQSARKLIIQYGQRRAAGTQRMRGLLRFRRLVQRQDAGYQQRDADEQSRKHQCIGGGYDRDRRCQLPDTNERRLVEKQIRKTCHTRGGCAGERIMKTVQHFRCRFHWLLSKRASPIGCRRTGLGGGRG